MSRENLLTLFEEFARHRHDPAIISARGYRREIWSYDRLAGIAIACAFTLRKGGVKSGERVLLWGANSAEWAAAFWGCLLCGAVAVPMDDGAHPEFVTRVVREADVKFAFLDSDKPEQVGVPALRLEGLPDGVRGPHLHITAHSPGEVLKPLCQTLADQTITRSHIAQILFTSGTTGEPRGVALTHGNFLANLEPLEREIAPYRKYERWLHPLRFVSLIPLSHVFGQFMALFVPPLLGATLVFELSANPIDIVRTVKRERATALIAVPRMLEALRAGIERELEVRGESSRFSRTYAEAAGKPFLRRAWRFRPVHRRFGWRFWAFISGGAALAGGTEEFFKRLGYAMVQGYGMTETASLISLNHPFRAAQGSVGKVLPGREFQLAQDGEILVRGENVAAGYWERGKLRPASEGGWLRTGDLGEIDLEGNLRFRGRKKNVIVMAAGLNVYPEDLEQALKAQPEIRDAVVIPTVESSDTNAEALAVLLSDNRDRAALAQSVSAANHSLAEYQRIRRWIAWPEADFPRTATGKPRLNVIAERVATMRGPAHMENGKFSGGGETTSSPVETVLQQLATGDAGANLEHELRLSSLDRVELLSALEQKFQIELNESAFSAARTLGDVLELVTRTRAEHERTGVPSTNASTNLLRATTEPKNAIATSLPSKAALATPASMKAELKTRAEYDYPRWAQLAPVRWIRLIIYYMLVWPATQILGHPRIVGRENLRGVRGPVLVVSNHLTRRADIGLILAALPARFRHRLATAMGGETLQEMRHPPREWFFAKRWAYGLGYWLVTAVFNVFPLPQFSGVRESFRFAGESMDRGYSVLVFPEGVVNNTETGEMASFQAGIGLLAQELHAPVVPMRLDGVWQMKRARRRLAHRGEIIVRIGAPVSFASNMPPQEVAAKLQNIVREL